MLFRVAATIDAALMALSSGLASAETISGKVVGVADGDTLTVLDAARQEHKVRLDGIDAPEKRQDFGERSKQSLSDLVYGKAVEFDTHKRDRYGRRVGKVLLLGKDMNLEQVRRGMAWHYRAYAGGQSPEQRVAYAAAEEDARVNHRGLWREVSPVAPWDYRSAKSLFR